MSRNQPQQAPSTISILIAFAIIYITWGTTFLAIKYGVQDEHMPPALFGGSRILAAGLILLAYMAARGQSIWLSRADLARLALTGTIMFVGGNGLLHLGQKTIDSSVAAVLSATNPLFIGLFAMLWSGGDRLTIWGWVGLILGLGGVLLIFASSFAGDVSVFANMGPFCVLGSAASWALGAVVARHRRPQCSHLAAAAYQMTIGGALLALIGIAAGEIQQLPSQLTIGAVFAFVYLLVAGCFLGFVAYNWLLGHVSAAKVGTHSYVNPVVAVLLGWAVGEAFSIWVALGIVVILIGVALVRNGEVLPRRVMRSEAEAPAQTSAEIALAD